MSAANIALFALGFFAGGFVSVGLIFFGYCLCTREAHA